MAESFRSLIYFGLPQPEALTAGSVFEAKSSGLGLRDGRWEPLIPRLAETASWDWSQVLNLEVYEEVLLDVGPLSPIHHYLLGPVGAESVRAVQSPRIRALVASLSSEGPVTVLLDEREALPLNLAYAFVLIRARERGKLTQWVKSGGRRWRGIIHHSLWAESGCEVPAFRSAQELRDLLMARNHEPALIERLMTQLGSCPGVESSLYSLLEYLRELNATSIGESTRCAMVDLLLGQGRENARVGGAFDEDWNPKLAMKDKREITAYLLRSVLL